MKKIRFYWQKLPVTISLICLCLIITLPGVISGQYFELFSGELPHEYWWQKITMVFQHGIVGNPVAIILHLSLNMILLFFCGFITERILGSLRFLILSLSAWLCFIVTQWLSGVWINGSSGIIWAYSPFMLIVILEAKKDPGLKSLSNKATLMLIIMWGIVTVIMGIVPRLFNPSHSLLHTFFFGNLFHFMATFTGFLFYFMWKNKVEIPDFFTEIT